MPQFIDYAPHGAAAELFTCKRTEVILSGPAGTGKSRSCLEKLHLCLLKYAGAKGLALRKTQNSLTATGIATYRSSVQPHRDGVTFFGGSAERPPSFRYPNDATLELGGLGTGEAVAKIMSADYDMIYVQEATDIREGEWESLTTRLRNGIMPYQQIIADCNPQSPHHWVKRRAIRGNLLMLESRHEDNPILWSGIEWTERGTAYLEKLDRLSGVRRERLRHGRWVVAEGVVYEEFDSSIHVIDHFDPPSEWRRIRSIDFGFVNPFTCQWWAVDHDGAAYLYREIYQTQRLIGDLADQINTLTGDEIIETTVADHDAEGRAQLHEKGIYTKAANKAITSGIQKVQEWLRVGTNGKPRLYLMRDALVAIDQSLDEESRPFCVEQEFESYVWAKTPDGKLDKEVPVDLDNHGLDALRYATMYLDGGAHLPYSWMTGEAEG